MNSIAFPFPQVGDKVLHSDILLEGEELDAPFPVGVMVNKPVGYVVTAPDDDKILDPKVYDLLPYRCFGERLGGRVSSDCVRFPGWRHPTTVCAFCIPLCRPRMSNNNIYAILMGPLKGRHCRPLA